MSRYCRLILVFGFLFAGMVLLFKRCEAVVKLRRMFDDVKSRLAELKAQSQQAEPTAPAKEIAKAIFHKNEITK